MRLLFREDWQVFGDEAKDSEAQGNEHGGDYDLRPLGRVARANRIFYAGDRHVEPVGYKAQQRQDSRQVKTLRALANLRNQQQPKRASTERKISSRKKRCSYPGTKTSLRTPR